MERTLYSTNVKCKSGCQYCFAKWESMNVGFPIMSAGDICDYTQLHVIYPSCDSEFSMKEGLIEILETISNRKNVVISLSTKQFLTPDILASLARINSNLEERGGFVKVGVSFSSKLLIDTIEPNTASYYERIETLRNIISYNIPSAVVLKPVLPFVSLDEYMNIINDTLFVQRYLTGGLYINTATDFYKQFIKGQYAVAEKKVNWVCGNNQWLEVCQDSHITRIQGYIKSIGAKEFSSDIDMIKEMYLSRRNKGGEDNVDN